MKADSGGHGAAPARAALAGNPSDAYGGAVLAVAIEQLSARTRASAAAVDEVSPPSELIRATVSRLRREDLIDDAPCAVEWSTSVPRAVGLGGSSAIVIAAIRALCDLHDVRISADATAALALAVEVEDLGIAAGPQDRVASAYGGLTFMDFAPAAPRYERLEPGLLPPLLVGWREHAGEDSGPLHAGLQERYAREEPGVLPALMAAAAAAHRAREALARRDHAAFCAQVDATFDARRSMLALDPLHVEMIELARDAGAAANYTGSGGAIVAVCKDSSHREAVASRLRSAGCGLVFAPD